jgi:hypothetical protein
VSMPKHTQFAMKALDMAEMFKMLVGAKPIEGPEPYGVELGTPDGPSTGGGKQAMQAIKLVPQGSGATLVAGHANKAERTAELRTYNFLAQQHAQRFKGAQLPVTREAYDELMGRLEKFFRDQDLNVSKLDAPEPSSAPPETAAPSVPSTTAPIAEPTTSAGPWKAIAIGAGVVLAAVTLLLLK